MDSRERSTERTARNGSGWERMPPWSIPLLGGVSLLAAFASHSDYLKLLLMFFVPGGALVFYLKNRKLAFQGEDWIFLTIVSVAISMVVGGINNLLLVPSGRVGTTSEQLLIAGFALSVSIFAVVLIELMLLGKIGPVGATFLGWLFAMVSTSDGLVQLGRVASWLLAAVVALSLVGSLVWHVAIRKKPTLSSALVPYFASWLVVMLAAAFSVK